MECIYCIYMHTCIHLCRQVCRDMHLCMWQHKNTITHICIYLLWMYVCKHTWVDMGRHVYMYIHTEITYIYIYIYICMYVCIYVYIIRTKVPMVLYNRKYLLWWQVIAAYRSASSGLRKNVLTFDIIWNIVILYNIVV